MSNTRNTGFLTNVIKTDSEGNVTFVSGSTTLLSISSSGAVTTTGVISGSNALTSSYSQNSELLDNLDSTSFVFTSSFNTYSSSMSTRVTNNESTGSTLTTASASFAVVSSSYSSASGSLSTRVTKIEGNYATTGSNVFLGAQTVCANITSTGTIIAQTLNVQQVTSSVVYSCGSNIFGTALNNTQTICGNIFSTGSLACFAGTVCASNGSFTGCIGIGKSPDFKLDVGGQADGVAETVARIGNVSGVNNGLVISKDTSNNYCYHFANGNSCFGGTNIIAGCLGIGTTPTQRLTIAGNILLSGTSTNLNFNTPASGNGDISFDGNALSIVSNSNSACLLLSTNSTARLQITSTGIATFACQVCANAFIASSGIRANNGSITSCNGTIGGAAVFIADAPDNTSDIGYRVHVGGSLKWFIGLPNNVVNDNFSIFQGGCSVDRLTIDTTGNVGIGTSSPIAQLQICSPDGQLRLSGDGRAQMILSTYAKAWQFETSCGAGNVSACSIGLVEAGSGTRFQIAPGGVACFSSKICAPTYNFTGASNSCIYADASYTYFVTSNANRFDIDVSGIATFYCRVCTPQLTICRTYNANNLMLSVANSTMSVPFTTYDTAIIQADDVTTLKIIERNGGSSDNQVLTLSTGDNTTRISTSGINPLQFFVGGSSAGCGYNGLGGRNAISIACSGTSTFNYPVFMGNIGHYNNYSNTSGCFAVFCASQGAILYVTSMHNGGRATYQLLYSNGATGGASISVIGQTSAYGPACTAFALCANGWVYAYQPYGGPTDYYAISMNSNFAWGF